MRKLVICDTEITLPADHRLPDYLDRFPQYDYLIWNIVGALLAENGLSGAQLVDIGANVGDTALHFRRVAHGPVWAIEADPDYFEFLKANTAHLDRIETTRALVGPERARGRLSLSVSNGTGATAVGREDGYVGQYLSVSDLVKRCEADFVIKSDTDGFDGDIAQALVACMHQGDARPAVVAIEGPTRQQMRDRKHGRHLAALRDLQAMGYRIQILTNIGQPYAFVGCDSNALNLQFRAFIAGLDHDKTMCSYFDFICVAPGLRIETFDFTPEAMQNMMADIHH